MRRDLRVSEMLYEVMETKMYAEEQIEMWRNFQEYADRTIKKLTKGKKKSPASVG